MKKVLILALAFVTIQITAQEQSKKESKTRMHKYDNMTAEEAATLQTKKMTLALDLTEEQQEKVQKINLENAKQRKATMEAHKSMKESGAFEKLTDEQKMELKNARLDKQIAMKKKMKEVLNEEQYKKWSEHMEARHEKQKQKMKAHKKHKESIKE